MVWEQDFVCASVVAYKIRKWLPNSTLIVLWMAFVEQGEFEAMKTLSGWEAARCDEHQFCAECLNRFWVIVVWTKVITKKERIWKMALLLSHTSSVWLLDAYMSLGEWPWQLSMHQCVGEEASSLPTTPAAAGLRRGRGGLQLASQGGPAYRDTVLKGTVFCVDLAILEHTKPKPQNN